MSKIAVIVFPGSNCDADALHAFKNVLQQEATFHWHTEEVKEYDLVVLPGGFSYGDYLRVGAIAKLSPAVQSLHEYIKKGGKVLGICNGFQILVETGILPGALVKNKNISFQCHDVHISYSSSNQEYFPGLTKGLVSKMPIAHSGGRYVVSEEELHQLKINNRIAFQYCDENGSINHETNVNGSVDSIAGIFDETFQVLGLMPHPERACEKLIGSDDGAVILNSLVRGLCKS